MGCPDLWDTPSFILHHGCERGRNKQLMYNFKKNIIMAGIFFVVILIVALNEFATDVFNNINTTANDEENKCIGYQHLNHQARD